MERLEFNKAMMKLDGYTVPTGYAVNVYRDYYNDLNLLMPLFWKLGGDIEQDECEDDGDSEQYFRASVHQDWDILSLTNHEDPIQAIRQCLIEIARGEE